ncbi:MAG: putrescine aminotransferase [Candidatus Aminicenantes bacterium]|nr:putrescine aminotransferase [Candidatus Aminicenantes bacterium]
MKATKEVILAEATKILDFIAKDRLSEADKKWAIDETVRGFKEHINPGFLEYRKGVSTDYTALEWRDSRTTFQDIHGKTYIDCLGGFGMYNTGHRHPKIIRAVKNQLKKQALHSLEILDPLRPMLGKLVAMITPGKLQYSFFCNSGSEAVEGAFKITKLHTQRKVFIAATRGYHGKTAGALSATARGDFRQPFMPLLPGFIHLPYGDADSIEAVAKAGEMSGDRVAAVILEPVQGEGGINVPPPDYFPKVRQICDRYGALFIIDEVQTGMGRTGKLWGCEHYGVAPDIMTVGKSFGGGVIPVAAFVSTKEIWQKLTPNPFLHTSTFGGNTLACAAAIASIKVTLEENLPQRAAESGKYFLANLKDLVQRFNRFCIEARGLGLMMAVEFNSDRVGFEVAKRLFDAGILVAGTLFKAKTLRFQPPLIITRKEIDFVLETLEKVFKSIDRDLKKLTKQDEPDYFK